MRIILQYILKILSKLVLARHKPFVIAITGSVGKTSAKEAIFTVLDSAFPGEVRKSEKNLNTEIGLPLAIIGGENAGRSIWLWLVNFTRAKKLIFFSSKYPKYLVLEMGADKPGDIEYLTSIVRPNIAVVSAIGEIPVHLEFYSSKKELVKEKSKIVKALKSGGVAVLNFDDNDVKGMSGLSESVISYGFNEGVDVRGSGLDYSVDSGVSFQVNEVPVKIKRNLGRGVAYAALAAIAVGTKMGVSIEQAVRALADFKSLPGRLTLLDGIKSTLIIDDTYNASPLSMVVAINVLSRFEECRKIAVLGDMLELGINTEEAHRDIVKRAVSVADIIFFIGDAMVFAQDEVGDENVFWFRSESEARQKVQDLIREGDVILVKGSQSVRLERLVEEIMADPLRAKDLLVRQDKLWKNKP